MLSVMIGSWNVATKAANKQLNLTHWLENSLSPAPEIIVLGFQELLPQTSIILKGVQESWFMDGARHGSAVVYGLGIWE
jgi:hypothetical protein